MTVITSITTHSKGSKLFDSSFKLNMWFLPALRLFQEHNGLKVTGKIDKKTWQLMNKPRCGVPDMGEMRSPPRRATFTPRKMRVKMDRLSARSRSLDLEETPKRSGRKRRETLHKWDNNAVTFNPRTFSYRLPIDAQNCKKKCPSCLLNIRQIFAEAFRRWSMPSQLTVSKSSKVGDIDIIFASRNHGDGDANAFDGRGMLLAHAYPPGDVEVSGDIHFDLDENWGWKVNRTDTHDLMMVAMHEAGHSLGLAHSRNRNDIMFASYLDYDPDPQLNSGDIAILQKLYGKRPGFVQSPRKKKFFDKKNKKLPKSCRINFNDVFLRGFKVLLCWIQAPEYLANPCPSVLLCWIQAPEYLANPSPSVLLCWIQAS
ncbi:matrix metalloproteinase-9-like [Physella acuta]|uniref:matrix metalloproteinase-9-like n=1 Tax=Physella acuta TaxID=109671 RepID=UPI0027DC2DBB|nr:matrix metalloproteinase-9-like [Physella acuta]